MSDEAGKPDIPDAALFEKLGVFYLGRNVEPESGELADELLLYDSRDLLTHALCVGMTGSGKTGLGVSLLEEAALDGVPALILDPKGDMGNLLLTFPDLAPGDFAPWIDPEEAARKGQSVEERAAAVADLWRNGLAAWGEDGERIRRLREKVDIRLYTPGSEGGRPLSILASFAAPPQAVLEDPDLLRDRVHTLTASLLGLLGLPADPVQSREYILLATLLETLWRQGRDVDLAGLVQAVQSPPMGRIGVLDLESFYPSKERFQLALTLNNLLAAPTFQAWTRGEPLDVDRLLYDDAGKPRLAILHLAHLAEAERMFFVSLLLNQLLGWLRSRPGTTSLRALLYMDEIFGYLPPVAEPPSKKPMLTLLKQARAFGLGVVLATQNPVDLDYKALSNMGTWFLGRLQTERDRERLLDGLVGASGGGLDRRQIDRLLAGLDQRVFLLHNVHEEGPVLFHTRWAMSYLKGPLSRQQVRTLTAESIPATGEPVSPAVPRAAGGPSSAPTAGAAAAAGSATGGHRPVLPPEVPQAFLRPPAGAGEIFWEPFLLGAGRVHFVDKKHSLEHREDVALVWPLAREGAGLAGVEWAEAWSTELTLEGLDAEPRANRGTVGGFAEVPSDAAEPRSYRGWEKDLSEHLYRRRRLTLLHCPLLDQVSEPGEDERAFRIRLSDEAREARDRQVAEIKQSYRRKLERLEDQQRSARQAKEREEAQASQRKMDTVLSLGATVLSAFLGRGRRGSVSRASSALKGVGRAVKEHGDVGRAEEKLDAVVAKIEALEAELAEELAGLEERYDPQELQFEPLELAPRRSDVVVERVVLLWAPAGWRP